MAQLLRCYFKISINENKKEKDDEFSEWEEDNQSNEDDHLNIGLQEIKLIKF